MNPISSLHSCALWVKKPAGLTSSDIVVRLKIALTKNEYVQKGFRIGHGGTLDPFATGVLVILIGEGTKLADSYLHSKKKYTGLIRLGEKTDCADLTGPVIETQEVPTLTSEEWNALAQKFTIDRYMQMPPMHSAKKQGGKPLYHLAHQGETVARVAILKKIHSFQVQLHDPSTLSFEVECESGTYVRVLAEDLAAKAGTVAHLCKLERTQSSDATFEECADLENLLQEIDKKTAAENLPGYRPLSKISTHLPVIQIDAETASYVRQGLTRITQKICFDASKDFSKSHSMIRYALVKQGDAPIALLEKGKEAPLYRIQRVFNP